MSTYREIHGKAVKSLSTDPSAETDAGQIWYNTTSDTFKSIVALEAWSSAAPMINTNSYQASSGTQTAGITSGGYQLPSSLNVSEDYNGSGWTANANINTARGECGGAGPQTAALIVGGDRATPPLAYANTETFDGSSWSEQPDMNNARFGCGAAGEGTQTASLAFGGYPSPLLGKTEEYDGSSWSNQNDLNTPGAGMQGWGAGTQTAGLAMGRTPNGNSGATELYDGTNWTTSGAMNTSRDNGAGGGPQTAAYAAGGGNPGATTATETFDGTSWTTSAATLGGAARGLSGLGNSSSGLAMGNYPAANTTSEFNKSGLVYTAGAWASGGNYPSSVQGMGAAGTQTASVTAGGAGPTNLACEYDGSAWSTITNYPVSIRDVTGAGVQTAGLMISGYSPGNTEKTNSWNGSSWTGEGDLNNSTNRQLGGSAGIETAALFWGGDGGTPITAFESYNGSAWTALTAAPFGGNSSGCGTSTAALATPGPAVNTYEYGGSSWTAGGSTINRHEYGNTTGTQTAALIYSGGAPGSPAAYANNCEGYDGTAWSTRPSLAQSKQIIGHGSAGTQTAALATAGYLSTGATNTTEEFTGETTALNVKTLTQS